MPALLHELRSGSRTPREPCFAVLRRQCLSSPFVAILAATVFAPCLSAAQDQRAVYEKDVEFLLIELEKKAGHFFDVKGVDWPAVPSEAAQGQDHPPEPNGAREQEIRRFPSPIAPLPSSAPGAIRASQAQKGPAHDSVSIGPVWRHFARRPMSEFGRINLRTGHGDRPDRVLDAVKAFFGHGNGIPKGLSLARSLHLIRTWTYHENLANA